MNTKSRVLALLEKNRGQSVSGGLMAEELGVSRNAVWKAIKELEKDGHEINAVTNKGYCLNENNDVLSVQGMLPFLRDKEAANKIFIHAFLETTNKTAKEMAISGAEHGTMIIANGQTGGKGRYGRQFFSPAGHGIYMSLILHPARLRFHTPTLVTSLAAVAVCEAIEAVSGKEPKIKWVNDIFLGGRKICGISSEAVTDFESGNVSWVVLGIGINFTVPENGYPDEIKQIVGAVFSGEKPSVTRNRLICEVSERILGNSRNEQAMLNEYRSRLMFLGERVTVHEGKQTYEATAIDIDDTGRLIIRKDDEQITALSAGEISIRGRLSP